MRTSLSLRIPETLMIPASQNSLLAVCFACIVLLFAISRQPATTFSVYWNCSVQIIVPRE